MKNESFLGANLPLVHVREELTRSFWLKFCVFICQSDSEEKADLLDPLEVYDRSRLFQLVEDLRLELTDHQKQIFCLFLWEGLGRDLTVELLRQSDLQGFVRDFYLFNIDLLVAHGQYRRALSRVRQGVKFTADIEWADGFWERLPTIWKALGIVGFDWSRDQGVKRFVENVMMRETPSLSFVAT